MLVLGEKYKFSERELSKLEPKFRLISFVKYKDRNSREVRKEIEGLLIANSYRYLIINTSVYIDPKMIKFLTLLQFRVRNKRLKIITIEKFLEKHLHKCFIPDNDRNLSFLSDIRPYNGFEYALKRCIDYIGGSALYVVHFFMKFYIKKKINEQSPGSLYFVQSRVGLNNKEFECIKYRSMVVDAEKDGVKFASRNDERVFPFGEFMRKMRIDEVPQCLNVLKGQMHLIGPRPERKYWINFFEKDIPYYNERHLVRPGITGWAQVNYPYGENAEDAKQKLMYDLYYIKYWSVWLEIKTIIKTIAVMAGMKGM